MTHGDDVGPEDSTTDIEWTVINQQTPVSCLFQILHWCNIVTGNSTLTVGLVYRSPNISIEENTKVHNAIKEVSKRYCIIMGDCNHRHIQWTSLQSTGREDQEFF